MENKNFIYRRNCPICLLDNLEIKFCKSLDDPRIHLEEIFKENISPNDTMGAGFNVVLCPRCDFFFVTDVPTDEFYEKLTSFRSKIGAPLLRRQMSQGIHYFANYGLEAEKISVLLNLKPYDINVLEFGSGNGHWLLMAKAYGYNVCGIEIREDRIDFSKKNGLLIFHSIEELGGQKFDFVRSDLVFEHLVDPLFHLHALVKCLKPNGIIQIGVPEGDKIRKVLPTLNEKPNKLITPFGHINCFTHKSLVALAKKAGLTLVSTNKLRMLYFKAMLKHRDTKYIGELIKAGRKQNRSCTLYFYQTGDKKK